MRKILILMVVFFGLIVITQAQGKPEREIYTVLHYGDDAFDPNIWLASAEEQTDRTTATWRSANLDAVAYADFLHFEKGVKPPSFDDYFDNDWFTAVFTNYQGYKEMNRCDSSADMRLIEFSTLVNDQKYTMRYWIQRISPSRILTLFIVVPNTHADILDDYANKLFPSLVSCEKSS